MRYRQIHLDFHTSSVIPDVGEDFDINDFVNTLKETHVNSINIFAKCHHGMCYYPTKVGRMHPSLKFDLMGTMIKALHENDITCPIYFPLGWEEDAANHTDWLEIGRDNIPGHKLPTEAGYYRWRKLCLNNKEYREYIKQQLTEIMDNYEVDGFWFDIISQEHCLCPTCLTHMKSLGLNPDNDRDVIKHDDIVLKELQEDLNNFVHSYNPDITTVYNTGWGPDGGYDSEHTIENRSAEQDHVEIESLPSGEWGYLHFPLLVNFHNRNNAPLVGMNGKFHLSWGDHGSLKNQEALEFECYRMIANGCCVCVGDQLHPRGAMNHSAYNRISKVYKTIENLEPHLENTKKCADIGVVVSADFYTKDTVSDEGVLRMLMQLHYQFDLITITDDLSKYQLLILPDNVRIDEEFNTKLSSYLSTGGHILATNKSTCSALGIEYISDNEYTPSYIVIDKQANEMLDTDIDLLEYICYETGSYVKADNSTTGYQTAAYIGKPYYNRTCDCFSSHRHFPYEKTTRYPAILLSDNIGYCAFPLFKDYLINGNKVYMEIIDGLIKKLLPNPAMKTDAPSFAEMTLREQFTPDGAPCGYVIHLLSYIPQRLTRTIDIVNEPAFIPAVDISARCKDINCTKITSALTGQSIEFTQDGEYINFAVPNISGYECICIK